MIVAKFTSRKGENTYVIVRRSNPKRIFIASTYENEIPTGSNIFSGKFDISYVDIDSSYIDDLIGYLNSLSSLLSSASVKAKLRKYFSSEGINASIHSLRTSKTEE